MKLPDRFVLQLLPSVEGARLSVECSPEALLVRRRYSPVFLTTCCGVHHYVQPKGSPVCFTCRKPLTGAEVVQEETPVETLLGLLLPPSFDPLRVEVWRARAGEALKDLSTLSLEVADLPASNWFPLLRRWNAHLHLADGL